MTLLWLVHFYIFWTSLLFIILADINKVVSWNEEAFVIYNTNDFTIYVADYTKYLVT